MPHPSTIPYDEIVASIFGETVSVVRMGAGAPGRSWIAWQKPSVPNEFDQWIAGLIQRRKKPTIQSKSKLEQNGITCPYYAARFYALVAIDNANQDLKAYGPARVRRLEHQRDAYAEMIRAARLIQEGTERKLYSSTDAMPSGDPYWEGRQRTAASTEEIYGAGKAALEAVVVSIERAERWIEHLSHEIERIAPDHGRPDVWKTSYATTMGNLWRLLTGEYPPYDSSLFGEFLTTPTTIIGATQTGWGQMKTLRERHDKAGPGRGFDRGAGTGLSLLRLDKIESRGKEVANLVRMAASNADPIAAAIVQLIDMTDEPRATVLREGYLKPIMIQSGVFTPATAVQLGWQTPPSAGTLSRAFAGTIALAKAGDGCAAAVIEMARHAPGDQEASRIAQELDWSTPYAGLSRTDLMYDLYSQGLQGHRLGGAVLGLLSAHDPVCAATLPAVNLRIQLSQAPEDAQLRTLMASAQRNADQYHSHQSQRGPHKSVGYRPDMIKP